MFSRILVPLDGSGLAEGVFPYVRDLAPNFRSEVHVIGISIWPERDRSRVFETYLEKKAENLVAEGIKARAVHAHGNPAEELLKYAEGNKIDLIAMTTHGHSGFTRWLVGSTAEKIVQGATCPVLLARGAAPETPATSAKEVIARILVPLDGSKLGEGALPFAEAMAKKVGSFITLVHVSGSPDKGFNGTEPANRSGSATKNRRGAVNSYLKSATERLKKKGLKADYEVLTGNPAEEVLDYARNKCFSLIAMSTHGRSGVARWVLGSVVDKVIRGGETPVLVAGPAQAKPAARKSTPAR